MNKDTPKLMSIFKDTSNRHASLIMTEIDTLIRGEHYVRAIDLQRLIPVWDWEMRNPQETNDDKEVGLTVHVLARLQSALDEEHLKWASGFAKFDITKRLQLLAAINSERRMLEIQLNIKPVAQLTDELPQAFQAPALRKTKTFEAPAFAKGETGQAVQ